MRIDPMKRLLLLSLIVSSASVYAADKHEECNADDTVTAQASALLKVAEKLEADGCPAPKASDYKSFCDSIAAKEKPIGNDLKFFDFAYEKRLMTLSCADIEKDGKEAATEKVGKMWTKYNKSFKCQSSAFNVEKGNILKFALTQNFTPFLETIVSTYNLDINFVDPADQRNLMDYVNDELKVAISVQGPTHPRVKVLKEYKELLEGLGATPSKQ
jgi:hypothetical protein